MKIVLLLCLISLFACKINIIETGICLISNPKIKEFGLKLLSYLNTQQFSDVLPTIIKSFPELYDAFTECLSNSKEEDIVLQDSECRHPIGYQLCIAECALLSDRKMDCIKNCVTSYC